MSEVAVEIFLFSGMFKLMKCFHLISSKQIGLLTVSFSFTSWIRPGRSQKALFPAFFRLSGVAQPRHRTQSTTANQALQEGLRTIFNDLNVSHHLAKTFPTFGKARLVNYSPSHGTDSKIMISQIPFSDKVKGSHSPRLLQLFNVENGRWKGCSGMQHHDPKAIPTLILEQCSLVCPLASEFYLTCHVCPARIVCLIWMNCPSRLQETSPKSFDSSGGN